MKESIINNWNLFEIAEIFLEIYPEDVFINTPEIIVKLRTLFKELLKFRKDSKEQKVNESKNY